MNKTTSLSCLSVGLLALLYTGCGDLAENSERMRERLDKMSDAVHRQSLAIALEQMLSDGNTKILHPPMRMMPFAKAIGEEATPLELMQICYVFQQEVKHATGNNDERIISFVAMSAIAGLAPPEKVEQIFRDQVDSRGLYEGTAYSFAAARYVFKRDYLFNQRLDTSTVFNVGVLREVVGQYEFLKYLAYIPYVGRFVFSAPSLGINIKVKPGELPFLAEKARHIFSTQLTPSELDNSEVKDLMAKFH